VFFYNNKCCDFIRDARFGICDDVPNSPAYWDIHNHGKWIAIVNNVDSKDLHLYAIDNCLIFRDDKNNKESTCDAALKVSDDFLCFVELKERRSQGWLVKAVSQLQNTLNIYHKLERKPVGRIECYVSNSLRPKAPQSTLNVVRSFKNDTGLVLKIDVQIDV